MKFFFLNNIIKKITSLNFQHICDIHVEQLTVSTGHSKEYLTAVLESYIIVNF